ncbi:MAG: P-loop NTPase fold protein [Alistipes indistinctus]
MDKEMVAKALCSFYENGDIQAGHNFIEKIIQAQLYLPKISQGQLLQYFTLKFKAILSNHDTDLIDEQGNMRSSIQHSANMRYLYLKLPDK